MEGPSKKCKLTDVVKLLLLAVYLDFSLFIRRAELGFDKGLSLLVEDDAGIIMEELQRMNVMTEVRNLKVQMLELPNFHGAFHVMNRYDKAEDLCQFLNQPETTPVLISQGILPEVAREEGYCIMMSAEETDASRNIDWRELMKRIEEDFVEHTEFFLEQLRLEQTSAWVNASVMPGLEKGLRAALRIFISSFRLHRDESETKVAEAQFGVEIGRIISAQEELSEPTDVADLVYVQLTKFLQEHVDIQVRNLLQVEGDVLQAIQSGKVILYDEARYYFPEKIFREACVQLLQFLSFSALKEQLCQTGALITNDVNRKNYTVKKCFTDVFGCVHRERFLCLSKELLVEQGSLLLEDMRRGR